MQTRFVVIPAMPQEKEQFPRRIGVPAVLGAGYDLYDTHGKTRLVLNYPTQAEAEYACASRNSQEGAQGNRLVGYG
ncbi:MULTISPECIES: hypothetical protein [Pseudomonas putida group]|uniref:hypothetical protein n=1 Tax=Pseudomonas putida group TaxID=136845 RepID=UPI001E4DA8B4|nr:hypothetical protein [Pseudomonas putida]MCE0882875.1 hypothetical protein [Pseudomonas putida]WVM68831.1 hypothetical protein V1687_09030 [Pseudomonas putida]